MGNNSWTHPPLFFETSGPAKRRKHYFCLLFSQYWTGVQNKTKKRKPFCQKNDDVDGWPILSSDFFWGGHFWKYKPPWGLPGTNPGFLVTQISSKSQGLKTVWSFIVKFLNVVARSSNSVALTFRCGSR